MTSHPKRKLLVITASSRGEYSVSNWLTNVFVEAWQEANPDGKVTVRELMKDPLPYVDLSWIAAMFTPPEARTEENKARLAISDALIAELKAADRIVIGTPMQNMTIPAILKTYLDHVIRVGETVTPDNVGMLSGKMVDIILASGGVYTPGSPTEAYNLASGYLRAVLGWMGLTDVNIVLAGRATVGAADETNVERFREETVAAAKRDLVNV